MASEWFPASCRRVSLLQSASCIAFTAALMTGCGGGPSQPPLAGNTSVTILATSTANDQLSELALNITSISLTNKDGESVPLLTTPEYIEFMHLNGNVEPLITATIPEGVYTSATVTSNDGVPLCIYLANGDISTDSIQTASTSDVTTNLPSPITVTGTSMLLELNLQVSQSTNFSACSQMVYGSVPFTVTPTFNLSTLSLAAQPTNITNGMATGLRGLVATQSSGATNFTVAGEYGTGHSAPTWQVTSNSSTVFQGITSASQLAVGMPVDMDASIQPDGTLLATRVAVYETNPSNLSYSIGQTSIVAATTPYTPATPLVNTVAIQFQGPDFAGSNGGFGLYTSSSAVFQTSGQMTNVSTLPFAASFNATNIVPGQNIFATTVEPNNAPLPATTLTLLPQTINGTVTAVSNDSSFTTYTVSLAAYDIFPNLANQPGQASLLTNPGTVVVYVDNNTHQLSATPPAVGSLLRFNGLVFNDNGTLRMDCAQITDGVAE